MYIISIQKYYTNNTMKDPVYYFQTYATENVLEFIRLFAVVMAKPTITNAYWS